MQETNRSGNDSPSPIATVGVITTTMQCGTLGELMSSFLRLCTSFGAGWILACYDLIQVIC